MQVATREFGIRGRPTNASRVAILTGIDRREVRKLRAVKSDKTSEASEFMSKPTQVLEAWFHEPTFASAPGQPLELHVSDGDISFVTLVRRHAPGIPPVAMIKELKAAGAIEETRPGWLRALKRSYVPSEINENQVRMWGNSLHDMGKTLEHNLMREEGDRPRFERRALSLSVDRRSLPAFEAFLAVEGQKFLESADDWLAAHQVKSPGTEENTLRLGVGLYEILDEPNGPTPAPSRGTGETET